MFRHMLSAGGLCLLLTLSACGREVPRGGQPNVIIYLIDALRADHLQPYGYGKATSPRIQKFADEGVVFEKAFAQTAWTRGSVASLFTGLYPSSHMAEDRFDRLPDSVPTIASELKSHGYHTYGFITNGNVSATFGFDRGFDSYRRLPEKLSRKSIHVPSDELISDVKTFFKNGAKTPMFLYVHATDPHEPYRPEPFNLDIPKDCDTEQEAIYRPHMRHGRKFYRGDTLECAMALYDSEILKSDHYFGDFLDFLKANGFYDNSVIILTADHGEEFMEHSRMAHGSTLYQGEILVPLIVRLPRGKFGGERISSYARHIDVLPTVLDLLSSPISNTVQGQSLLPLVEGKSSNQGPVLGELTLDQRDSRYLIQDNYKLLQHKVRGNYVYELYDLGADPGERNNLLQKEPQRADQMKAMLAQWTAQQEKLRASRQKPDQATPDSETEEALRALGYVQ